MWRQEDRLRPGLDNYIGSNRWSLKWSFEEFGCVPCAPGELDESYYYIGNWLWSLWSFGARAEYLRLSYPLLLEIPRLSTSPSSNSYARIVVKTTLLVSFITVPQNEK